MRGSLDPSRPAAAARRLGRGVLDAAVLIGLVVIAMPWLAVVAVLHVRGAASAEFVATMVAGLVVAEWLVMAPIHVVREMEEAERERATRAQGDQRRTLSLAPRWLRRRREPPAADPQVAGSDPTRAIAGAPPSTPGDAARRRRRRWRRRVIAVAATEAVLLTVVGGLVFLDARLQEEGPEGDFEALIIDALDHPLQLEEWEVRWERLLHDLRRSELPTASFLRRSEGHVAGMEAAAAGLGASSIPAGPAVRSALAVRLACVERSIELAHDLRARVARGDAGAAEAIERALRRPF